MAQNPLPKPTGALLILAGKCEAGLTTYATPLGITQITPASLAADAAALGFCADGEVDRRVRFVGAVYAKDADSTRA